MSLTLTIAGKKASLLPAVAKDSGNRYFVLNGKPAAARFGIKVPALAATLPTEVDLDGIVIPLNVKVRERDGKVQAANNAATVQVDGQDKTAKVVLTDHGDGTWQVTAAVFGKGKGGGGSAVVDDLFS